jgi:tetratricopeptide (TPR) repeat protein
MTSFLVSVILMWLPLRTSSVSSASIENGDAEFLHIHYPEAIAIYESGLAEDSRNADLLWRLSRVYVCLSDVSPKDESEALYRKAVDYARKCIEADSAKSEGHAWLAASLGSVAMFEGSRSKVKLSHEIKKEVDKAILLNPGNDIAYTILGSFYRALGNVNWFERNLASLLFGGLPEGGRRESEVALKKAIQLAPNVMRHPYELGLLYLDWSRKEEAKAIFEKAVQLPIGLASDAKRLKKMNGFLEDLK